MTRTDLIKQVTASSEFQKHVKARNILMFLLRFDNCSIDEFEHVAMFQRGVHPYFLFNGLSILFGCFRGERHQFACCHAMILNVDCAENPGMVRSK